MSEPLKIPLGASVSDPITGFSGIVDARAEYLHEAPSLRVVSRQLQSGLPVDKWFPETRVVLDSLTEVLPIGFRKVANNG